MHYCRQTCVTCNTAARPVASPMTFYIANNGNDDWDGTCPDPTTDDLNGPFASLGRAALAVRNQKGKDGLQEPIRVILREGIYELDSTWQLGPDDAGSPAPTDDWNKHTGPECSVTWCAYGGESVVLSGGSRITGWSLGSINGRDAWVAKAPLIDNKRGFFTQLFVNGRRAKRSRLPDTGLFQVEKPLGTVLFEGSVNDTLFTGQNAFMFKKGELQNWENPQDIEFVGLHYWIESRINFSEINELERTATLAKKTRMRLTDDFAKDGAPYYVENVKEAVQKPGQWYLDRATEQIFYIPLEGEEIDTADIFAPRLGRIVEISGADNSQVGHIRFEGISFCHSEYIPGAEADTATPQAACHVPGAIFVGNAHDISFDKCRFAHLGGYGIEITHGSQDISVTASTIEDLGAGGIKVFHSFDGEAPMLGSGPDWNHTDTCRRILISDNEIRDGGHRAHQAVGVLVGRCSAVRILHNHIHNFDYTGVSVGWTWGYEDGEAYGNIVEYNHIHHIGRRMLSDMGGIYTLGVQPGTRLRYNHIHDVYSRGYGGWGIYNDEGSSHILIENNLVYRTKSNGYNQHYGQENIVRNNIFACGGEAQISRSRIEDHDSFIFTGNIVYSQKETQMLAGDWSPLSAVFDRNLYWCADNKEPVFKNDSFTNWQKLGADPNGKVADPMFLNPEEGDFTLPAESPAIKLGFVPFDVSGVGPRG